MSAYLMPIKLYKTPLRLALARRTVWYREGVAVHTYVLAMPFAGSRGMYAVGVAAPCDRAGLLLPSLLLSKHPYIIKFRKCSNSGVRPRLLFGRVSPGAGPKQKLKFPTPSCLYACPPPIPSCLSARPRNSRSLSTPLPPPRAHPLPHRSPPPMPHCRLHRAPIPDTCAARSLTVHPSIHHPSPSCMPLTPRMAVEAHVSWRLRSSPAEPRASTSTGGGGGAHRRLRP
jgi:hypothetical protein